MCAGESLPLVVRTHRNPEHRQLPRSALPVLRQVSYNLPYDEALEKYGLWKVKITANCWVNGKLLQAGDTAELTGDVVQQLVGTGRASITDKRMAEEADVINKAAALGLPQKIRELAAFAPPKKDRWSTRPRDREANE